MRWMRTCIMSVGLVSLITGVGSAQNTVQDGRGREGPRSVLGRNHEIALARSAAPSSVSDSATIYYFDGQHYTIAVRGSNDVSCYVGRSWPRSIEPHCFDAEGSATILPIEIFTVEMLSRGTTYAAVQEAIAAGISSGRFRLPRRPALTWMMSSAQELFDDEGRGGGHWHPHLMIYFPFLSAGETGLTGAPDPRQALLFDAGRPLSNLTIPVTTFIDPVDTKR